MRSIGPLVSSVQGLYNAAESLMTNEGCSWLCIGNPDISSSFFRRGAPSYGKDPSSSPSNSTASSTPSPSPTSSKPNYATPGPPPSSTP